MFSKPIRAVLGLSLFILSGWHAALAQSASADISLNGSLSSRLIREDELLQFTLAIRNKADAKAGGPVHHMKLMRLPDGYTLEENHKICVLPLLPPRHDSCQTPKEFLEAGSIIADSLAPGESLTIQGYLQPTSPHKTAVLTAVVTWDSSSSEPKGSSGPASFASAQSVSLGENQVQSSSWAGRLSIDELLKILAIPALLSLIGFITTLVINRVNVHSETWKQMLPVSHGYTKFYLQLSLAAERFADNLKEPNNSLAFFYLLMAGKKMIATRHEIGGFYFKDIRGETLAAECWKEQRLACLGKEDAALFKAVRAAIDQINDIEDIDAYEAFVAKYANDSWGARIFYHREMQQAWILFQDWAVKEKDAAVKRTIQYLEGFCAVLDMECNRPYTFWYDTPVRLRVAETTEKMLRITLKKTGYTSEETDGYFSAVTRP